MELLVDPKLAVPKAAIAWRLLKKGLGFRTLMDVISPDDDSFVKGSHGRVTDAPREGPVLIGSSSTVRADAAVVRAPDVVELMLASVFG